MIKKHSNLNDVNKLISYDDRNFIFYLDDKNRISEIEKPI